MILTSGGSRICTGSLINNGSQDLAPYFLTANHWGFSTAPVIGDQIILEYNEPYEAEFKGEINIETVAHDYRNIFFNQSRGYGDSGSCNNNVACSEASE